MRRRVVVLIAVLALVAVAVGGWLGWQALSRTTYERAVAMLPASTLRATWTDWDAVRSLADAPSDRAAEQDVDGFLSRAYDLDLTSTSAVADATFAMSQELGFSPLDASWEAYGQSREGAVVLVGVPDDVDLDTVEERLGEAGYPEPEDGPGSGGVWAGSADLVATVDGSLTPVFQNVVVLHDERVVVLSDNQAYASSAAEVVTGSGEGLTSAEGVEALVAAAGEPVSAVLYASDFACEALNMIQADDGDRAVAADLIEQAGGVSPLAGMVMAMQEDRSLVVGMHFESADQASDDLRPRTDLASGEAPGQGGSFSERFRVVEAAADGNEIVMDLEPAADDLPLLSDLSQGPLLFAAC